MNGKRSIDPTTIGILLASVIGVGTYYGYKKGWFGKTGTTTPPTGGGTGGNNPPPPDTPPTGYIPPVIASGYEIFSQIQDGIVGLDDSLTRIVTPVLFTNITGQSVSFVGIVQIRGPTGKVLWIGSVTVPSLGAGKNQQLTFTSPSIPNIGNVNSTYTIDVFAADNTNGMYPKTIVFIGNALEQKAHF